MENYSTKKEKKILSENQTENKSCGFPRCIIIIGFDMQILNFVKTKL